MTKKQKKTYLLDVSAKVVPTEGLDDASSSSGDEDDESPGDHHRVMIHPEEELDNVQPQTRLLSDPSKPEEKSAEATVPAKLEMTKSKLFFGPESSNPVDYFENQYSTSIGVNAKITALFSLRIVPNFHIVVMGDEKGIVRFWAVNREFNWHTPAKQYQKHTGKILGIEGIVGLDNKHATIEDLTDLLKSVKIVTTSADRSVIVWCDFDHKARPENVISLQTTEQHSAEISCVLISKKYKFVIVGSYDKYISVWDYDGNFISKKETGHTELVTAMGVFDDQTEGDDEVDPTEEMRLRVATAGRDGNICFTYVFGSKSEIFRNAHTQRISSMVITDFSNPLASDSVQKQHSKVTVLITGSADKTVVIWDVQKRQKIATLRGHKGPVSGIVITEFQSISQLPLLITSCESNTLLVWDVRTYSLLREINHYCRILPISFLQMNESEIFIIGGSDGKELIFWNINGADSITKINVDHHHSSSVGISVIKPGTTKSHQIVAVASHVDAKLARYDVLTAACKVFTENTAKVHGIIIHSDLVFTCDGQGFVCLWDLNTCKRLDSVSIGNVPLLSIVLYNPHPHGRADITNHRAFSFDENVLTKKGPKDSSSSHDESAANFSFINKHLILDLSRYILAVASVDYSIHFIYFDEKHRTLELQDDYIYHAHTDIIKSITIYDPLQSNVAPSLITSSYDKHIIIWNLGTLEKIHTLANLHTEYITALAVYDSQQHYHHSSHHHNHHPHPTLLSAGLDHLIGIWDIAKGKLRSTFGKDQGHREGFVALSIYIPHDELEDPLIITSGIGKAIIVWNLNTGDVIKRLFGHTDRVSTVGVVTVPYTSLGNKLDSFFEEAVSDYVAPTSTTPLVTTRSTSGTSKHPTPRRTARGNSNAAETQPLGQPPVYKQHRHKTIIISGGDDGNLYRWNESLHQSIMPPKDRVCKLFFKDLTAITDTPWTIITNMEETYKEKLFLENSYLFFLAVIYDTPSFLQKFWKYLKICIPLIQLNPRLLEIIQHFFVMYPPPNVPILPLHAESSLTSLLPMLDEVLDTPHSSKRNLKPNQPPQSQQTTAKSTKTHRYAKGTSSFNNPTIELEVGMDLLTYAIKKKDRFAIRLILLAWTYQFHLHMKDILHEHVFHAMHFFPYSTFQLLARLYPIEFIKFIAVLPLIRCHSQPCLEKSLSSSDVVLTKEYPYFPLQAMEYQEFWNLDGKTVTSYLIRAYEHIMDLFTPQDYDIEKSVSTLILPVTFAKSIKLLKLIVKVSTEQDNDEILDSEFGQLVLQHIWLTYGRQVHVFAFARYVFFLVNYNLALFGFQSLLNSTFIRTTNDDTIGNQASLLDNQALYAYHIFVLFLFGYYLSEEVFQLVSMRKKNLSGLLIHFSDVWNLVDIAIVMTGISGFILRLVLLRDTPTSRTLLVATTILMWCKIFYFLRPFSACGPLVIMLLQVIYQIRWFVLFLTIVLFAFAEAFWITSNNNISNTFGTITNSIISLYTFWLGLADLTDYSGTGAPYAGMVLFFLFLFVMTVVMLNFLIALMNDAFDHLRSRKLSLWRREQATIILEELFLQRYSFRTTKNHLYYLQLKEYLYILKCNTVLDRREIDYEDSLHMISEAKNFVYRYKK